MKEIIEDAIIIGSGLKITLSVLFCSFFIGCVFGFVIFIFIQKKTFNIVFNSFVSVIRGTPLILQLSLVYYGIPTIFDWKINAILAGIMTIGINSACYISEILRGGIESVSYGQFEAAISLKIPEFYLWKDIVLPQVFRNSIPSMVNESISLLKESAIISVIGCSDLMRSATLIGAQKFTYFGPLIIAGVYYYCLVLIIECIGRIMEKKYAYN